ncbi:MAG: hypothetical protein QME52_03250 [Bacteroidota bacterium]|nr:hypothetical protein [Bacteroidota bacterium]
MSIKSKYAHTNLIAKNWCELARFYQQVFGCVAVPPEHHFIAFIVEDVAKDHAEVLATGGSAVGEIVTLQPTFQSKVTWCYVADPEGNMIELQSWSKCHGMGVYFRTEKTRAVILNERSEVKNLMQFC